MAHCEGLDSHIKDLKRDSIKDAGTEPAAFDFADLLIRNNEKKERKEYEMWVPFNGRLIQLKAKDYFEYLKTL